jgi:two-component system, sensor histidine kinase
MNLQIKTSLKVSMFYFTFGLLIILFFTATFKLLPETLFLSLLFLILTAGIFGFVTYTILKKDIPQEKPMVKAVISEELTEIKEKYNKLIDEKKKIEILNEAKTLFLSNISQEIRTPMSGIIGMTELLLLTNLTKEQKEYLDIINFSSSTLLAIINDILDFSRIETGKLKLEKIEFNVRELIYKTTHILDFDAKRKKLSLNIGMDEKIDYNVIGDPLRVNQILINLLKNSINSTEKGHIEIELREITREHGKTWLEFKISDTGCGMSKKKLGLIFGDINGKEPLSEIPSFEYRGAGLGTAMVKHLILLMRGKMTVESSENEGSVFTLAIPFETVTPRIIKPVKKKKEEERPPEITRKTNILVAEDNIVNQRLVKELLIRKNFDVIIVENGLKIFDILEQSNFDIILMDIQMPVMDGLEATAIIREIEKGTGKHIPIIGITAYAVKADKEKCIGAGMDDYLAKPFIKEEFYNMIEKYLTKTNGIS